MTTRVITLWHVDVMSLTTSLSAMRFLLEILSILEAIKPSFKGPYDKQNLTLVVISYKICETRQRFISLISYEMTTCVRSSIYVMGMVLAGELSLMLLTGKLSLMQTHFVSTDIQKKKM